MVPCLKLLRDRGRGRNKTSILVSQLLAQRSFSHIVDFKNGHKLFSLFILAPCLCLHIPPEGWLALKVGHSQTWHSRLEMHWHDGLCSLLVLEMLPPYEQIWASLIKDETLWRAEVLPPQPTRHVSETIGAQQAPRLPTDARRGSSWSQIHEEDPQDLQKNCPAVSSTYCQPTEVRAELLLCPDCPAHSDGINGRMAPMATISFFAANISIPPWHTTRTEGGRHAKDWSNWRHGLLKTKYMLLPAFVCIDLQSYSLRLFGSLASL